MVGFRSYTFLGNALDKVFGDGIVDIGFKERHADFAHAFLDILLCQLALAGHFAQSVLQFLGQAFKCHVRPPLYTAQ